VLRRDELWLLALCPPVLGLVLFLAMGDFAGLVVGVFVGVLAGPMCILVLRHDRYRQNLDVSSKPARWEGAASGVVIGGLLLPFLMHQAVQVPQPWDSVIAWGFAIAGGIIGWYRGALWDPKSPAT
jgi:hypothetical protein